MWLWVSKETAKVHSLYNAGTTILKNQPVQDLWYSFPLLRPLHTQYKHYLLVTRVVMPLCYEESIMPNYISIISFSDI